MWCTRAEEAAAEGASCTALWIPRLKSPHLHREGRLKPCRAVLYKVDVCYATHNGLEETVVLLQYWRKGARCSPEVVKELWEGKGMLQKKDGVMGREVLETVAHLLQCGNLDLRVSVMDTVSPIDDPNKVVSLGLRSLHLGGRARWSFWSLGKHR